MIGVKTVLGLVPLLIFVAVLVATTGIGVASVKAKSPMGIAITVGMVGVTFLIFPVTIGAVDTAIAATPILTTPYTGGTAYTGILHQHSSYDPPADAPDNPGDGANTPQQIADACIALGHDFMVISDHYNYVPPTEVTGIVYIPGVEEDDHAKGLFTNHILALNVGTDHQYATYNNKSLTFVVSALKAEGALVGAAHPSWGVASWTVADIVAQRPHVMGIYDTLTSTDSTALWDSVLAHHGTIGTVWGIGEGDSHSLPDADSVYTVVYAPSLSAANIIAGLRAGNSYVSQGPTMTVAVSDRLVVTVTTGATATITFTGSGGAILQTAVGTTAAYTAKQADKYVRVTVTRTSDSKKAWSQPLFVS